MLRLAKPLLAVLLFVASALAQTSQLKDAEFISPSLGRTMHYRILLPATYGASKQSFPVLYLLHGLNGDYKNWSDKTAVAKYLGTAGLIVVMPDADDSWYTNWATDPQQKYEDYVIKDLLSEIEGHYRTIDTRDSRWVAGLSMGGYGALKFGLKYPQLFSIAASFSGALNAPDGLSHDQPAFVEQLKRVYGSVDSRTRPDNDIYELVKFANPEKLPYLYLTCGTADHLLAANREFVASLPARKIRYEYHELPGAHEWTFWDRSIHDFLQGFLPRLQH
jgi:putative tributyrin esterase